MNIETHPDLLALRQAAETRNHEQAQFLLKKLFMELDFFAAVAVAVECAGRFLSTFEKFYPAARWPRQILVQIASLGTAPGQLPPEAAGEFHAPGAANFLKTLSDLAFALHPNTQGPPRIGYLVSAVVNTIMAELSAMWYGGRLDDWERFRTGEIDPTTGLYHDPEVTHIAYAFWTDAAVAQQDTKSWLAVANAVEKQLRRAGAFGKEADGND